MKRESPEFSHWECQYDELKKVLTRINDNCKTIVIGHDGQIDLYSNPERSGFVGYADWFDGDSRVAVCKLTKNYRGWVSQHADDFDFAAMYAKKINTNIEVI